MCARGYTYTHRALGWGTHLNQKVIKIFNLENREGTIQSEYTGNVRIGKKGDLEKFKKGVEDLIIGNPRLELSLILGVCGLIVQELDEEDTNIVINFYGNSSSGKTLTTQISLTIFGDPSKLTKTFNTTENRVEKEMAEYQVIPAIMDDKLVGINNEINKIKASSIIKNIFGYATGHVKGRMHDKESFIKYYCPIIISTEESIMDLMKNSSSKGQYYRMFEIYSKLGELTKSREHSNILGKFLKDNYGYAGEEFARWMMKNAMYDSKLRNKYFDWKQKLINDFGGEEYADRMANRMAVIMLSGELLNECFGFNINLNNIESLLMNSVKVAFNTANEDDRHLINLLKYIKDNRVYFADCRNNCEIDKHLGQYRKNEYELYELVVYPEALQYILSGKEPEDYLEHLISSDKGEKFETSNKTKPINQGSFTTLLRQWKSKGILTSGRKSGETSTLTSPKTIFKNDKQIIDIDSDSSDFVIQLAIFNELVFD